MNRLRFTAPTRKPMIIAVQPTGNSGYWVQRLNRRDRYQVEYAVWFDEAVSIADAWAKETA